MPLHIDHGCEKILQKSFSFFLCIMLDIALAIFTHESWHTGLFSARKLQWNTGQGQTIIENLVDEFDLKFSDRQNPDCRL